MSKFLAAVKAHALANYGKNGWDTVVECWDDAQIEAEIKGCRTEAGAIAKVGKIVKVRYDHEMENRPMAGYDY